MKLIAIHKFDIYESTCPQNLLAVIGDAEAAVDDKGLLRQERLKAVLEAGKTPTESDGVYVYHLEEGRARCETWVFVHGSRLDNNRALGCPDFELSSAHRNRRKVLSRESVDVFCLSPSPSC